MTRRDEIAAGLARVRERIHVAAVDAGRDPGDITLVAVTKTFPADDVRHLAALGVRDVGENRDQEARSKHDACADLGLRWHFVGRLQRNKVRSVVGYADVVQSVDRVDLVVALDRAAQPQGRLVDVLVQVSLDEDPARGGAPAKSVPDVAAAVADALNLRLRGVMAVAPMDETPDAAFARLAGLAAGLRREHPDATIISAGMSGDLESAIQHGATHVRIGSALLGRRSAPVG